MHSFAFSFALIQKKQKVQGKPDRSARFFRPARGKSRWIIYKGRCGYFMMQAGNSISGLVYLPLILLML